MFADCKLRGAVSSPGFCTLQVFIYICLFVTLPCCYGFWINYDNIKYKLIRNQDIDVKMVPKTIKEEKLDNDLDTLEKLYSNQIEDTWITFSASIKSVIKEKPYKTSMFLLIFDSESGGKTAQCIAQDVSKSAIKYLMNKSGTPAVVNGEHLNEKVYLDDPGILLNELKEKVQEKGALVVTNLQEVPPKVAQMFHFVCDSYAPLVEKYVTFFTLRVQKLPSLKDQQKTASETMKNLWSSLDDNELNPLITRMTTNIIQIYPDSKCSV